MLQEILVNSYPVMIISYQLTYCFATAHAKGCVVRGGLLVYAVHGDPGEEGTCIHRESIISSLYFVVFAIPTWKARGPWW
jgi:hypothetical protein